MIYNYRQHLPITYDKEAQTMEEHLAQILEILSPLILSVKILAAVIYLVTISITLLLLVGISRMNFVQFYFYRKFLAGLELLWFKVELPILYLRRAPLLYYLAVISLIVFYFFLLYKIIPRLERRRTIRVRF